MKPRKPKFPVEPDDPFDADDFLFDETDLGPPPDPPLQSDSRDQVREKLLDAINLIDQAFAPEPEQSDEVSDLSSQNL